MIKCIYINSTLIYAVLLAGGPEEARPTYEAMVGLDDGAKPAGGGEREAERGGGTARSETVLGHVRQYSATKKGYKMI